MLPTASAVLSVLPAALMPDSLPDPDERSEALPRLQPADLETLLAALDPLLDGFGAGESCLDDAMAFLARLGVAAAGAADATDLADQEPAASPLLEWIERWRAAGGNRQTMRLMVSTLLASASEAPSPEQG
jgi:hypothetical protein